MFKKVFLFFLVLLCVLFLSFAGNSALGGFLEWQKTYGGSSDEAAQDFQQTSDKGFIIVGWTNSYGAGNEDFYVVKTDSLGNTVWTRTYGGVNKDEGECVQIAGDGGYVIVGGAGSFGESGGDAYLIKINSSGDTLWTRTYGGSYADGGHFVRQTSDSGYIVAGRTYSFGNNDSTHSCNNVYLVKTNQAGDTVWSRAYGSLRMDGAYCVIQSSDFGYVSTGWTAKYQDATGRCYDVYILKTNDSGDSLWAKSYGDPDILTDDDWGEWIEKTDDGGFIITGINSSFDSGNKMSGFSKLMRTVTLLGPERLGG